MTKQPFEITDTPTWICVGKLISGDTSPPISNAHIVFDRTAIHYVGGETPPAHIVQNEQKQPDTTLPNHTLLPGLIEGHSHLFLEGAELDFGKRKAYQAQAPEDLISHARQRLKKILKTGVIAMRDGGDKDGVGLTLKSEQNGNASSITSPGPAIYHKGRYGSFIGSPLENHDTPEACVTARIAEGADHIKVVPTGIINFQKGQVTKEPQMSAEETSAFVAAAKKQNKHVMAHASGTEGIENAIRGGVDTIEHGFFVTNEQLAYMRDNNVAWVPTFVPVQVQVDEADKMGWSKKIIGNLQKILDDHALRLQEADEMGVTIIAGSDAGSCGVAHGLGLLYELELMEQAGLSPQKNLHAVTGASVTHFSFNEKIGLLKPGYKPRMILTQHDPTETVSNLKKEKWVTTDGQWHYSEANMDPSSL